MVNKTILKNTLEKIIKAYKKNLEENGIKVEKMILFGSHAKGTAKSWSDLDLCVVSKQFGKDYHEELVKLMHLTLDTEPTIEPHPYHPRDLADFYDPLAYEINRTGRIIQ